jgi:hypothetical protein
MAGRANLCLRCASSPDIPSFEFLTIPLAAKLAKRNITLDWKIFKFVEYLLMNYQHHANKIKRDEKM